MLLWIQSDPHLELTRGWDLPAVGDRPAYDVLVIAGDLIPRMERGVRWILERVTDRQVIYIPGNHEFYGADINITVEKARALAAGTNVHVMQNDVLQIIDPAGPRQKQDLAAFIHLCGAGPATAFARRNFRMMAGERCGDHLVAAYVSRVNAMKREFVRLAADGGN